MVDSKQCTKCGEVKSLDEYNRHKRMKDGRHPRCRSCRREDKAEYNARPEVKAHRAEYDAVYAPAYYAANRGAVLSRLAKYRARPEVKARMSEHSVQYFEVHPHARWESRYRQRAKGYGFAPVVESFTKDDLIERYGDSCWHCGGSFEELDHHPVAVAHGGQHTLENCKPSCARCNRPGATVRRTNGTSIGETA